MNSEPYNMILYQFEMQVDLDALFCYYDNGDHASNPLPRKRRHPPGHDTNPVSLSQIKRLGHI